MDEVVNTGAVVTPPAQTTPPPPAAPATAPVISLSIEDYQRLKGLEVAMAKVEADQRIALQAKEDSRLAAMAAKEGAEKALGEQKATWETKLAEQVKALESLDTSINDERRDAVLAASLAGRTFSGSTVEDQRATTQDFFDLVKPRFETVKSPSGAREVREKGTGRPAADVMREILESPRYSHFFASQASKPAGSQGGNRPAPTGGQPEDPLLAHAAAWKAKQAQYQSFGLSRIG